MSLAVAVRDIALATGAAEACVIMLIYLDNALKKVTGHCYAEGGIVTHSVLYAAIIECAFERVRPKMMTVVATMAGLLPILWSHRIGSEVMQRIALPRSAAWCSLRS